MHISLKMSIFMHGLRQGLNPLSINLLTLQQTKIHDDGKRILYIIRTGIV